jgi:hypothetical protein
VSPEQILWLAALACAGGRDIREAVREGWEAYVRDSWDRRKVKPS